MYLTESNDYHLEDSDKAVVEDLYQNGILIGRKTTIKQADGKYREIIHNTNNQVVSDIKYLSNGLWSSGKIYKNGKIIRYMETDTDNSGNRHEVILNDKNEILSHRKFDKFDRYIGGLIYENNKIIKQHEIQYIKKDSLNGEYDVFEIVRDNKYDVILKRQLKDNRQPNPEDRHKYDLSETKTDSSVLVEHHEIQIDQNGERHEIIYDANHNILSDKTLAEQQTFKRRPIIDKTNDKKPEQKQVNIVNKIIGFLRKLAQIQK